MTPFWCIIFSSPVCLQLDIICSLPYELHVSNMTLFTAVDSANLFLRTSEEEDLVALDASVVHAIILEG
jgi:hypothetical protein